LTASEPRDPLEYLSFSRLNTYNTCGNLFRLRYVDRVIQEPGGPLLGGSALHTALEVMERKGLWPSDEGVEKVQKAFLDDFDAQLSEASDSPFPIRWGGRKSRDWPEGENADWWRGMGPLFVKRACLLRRADEAAGFTVKPEGVEMEVLAPLDDQIMVKGYIDAFLMVTPDGEPMLRDWKSGKVGGNNPLQLATYAWALAELGISRPTVGQYVYLRAGEKSKGLATYDLTAYLPMVAPMYQDLVKGIAAGVFPVQPGFLCGSCSVRHACTYGQALDPDHAAQVEKAIG
jgi:RecB family exonuclease